jgi:hypothetical protein
MRRWAFFLAVFVVAACRGQSGGDFVDFEGIQYRAPAGSTMRVQDGVLPGPEGLGGIPSGQRVEATITRPNAKRGARGDVSDPGLSS